MLSPMANHAAQARTRLLGRIDDLIAAGDLPEFYKLKLWTPTYSCSTGILNISDSQLDAIREILSMPLCPVCKKPMDTGYPASICDAGTVGH